MSTLIIGVCVIVVVIRLAIGNPGRPALVAAIVVGAFVGIAQDLTGSGMDILGSLSGAIEKLGS